MEMSKFEADAAVAGLDKVPPFKHPAKSERRAGCRYGCGAPSLVRLYLPDRNEFLFSWLRDISTHGIAFDLLTPLESGQEFLLQLKHGTAERTELRAEVVHAALAHGFCRIGCRFAAPLPPGLFRAIVQHLRGAKLDE
jgi:hypothetical protein